MPLPSRATRLSNLSAVFALIPLAAAGCERSPMTPSLNPAVTAAADFVVIDLSPPTADFPTPRPDTASAAPKAPVTIAVLANDADTVVTQRSAPDSTLALPLKLAVFPTVVGVTQPKNGSATLNANGTITYVSNSLTFWGKDEFTYTVVNTKGLAATATVTVWVGPQWKLGLVWPGRTTPPDSSSVPGGH